MKLMSHPRYFKPAVSGLHLIGRAYRESILLVVVVMVRMVKTVNNNNKNNSNLPNIGTSCVYFLNLVSQRLHVTQIGNVT